MPHPQGSQSADSDPTGSLRSEARVLFFRNNSSLTLAARVYNNEAADRENAGGPDAESRHLRVTAAYALVLANRLNISLAEDIIKELNDGTLTNAELAKLHLDLSAMYSMADDPEKSDEYLLEARWLAGNDPDATKTLEYANFRLETTNQFAGNTFTAFIAAQNGNHDTASACLIHAAEMINPDSLMETDIRRRLTVSNMTRLVFQKMIEETPDNATRAGIHLSHARTLASLTGREHRMSAKKSADEALLLATDTKQQSIIVAANGLLKQLRGYDAS